MAANSQKERYPEVVRLLTKNKIFLPKKNLELTKTQTLIM